MTAPGSHDNHGRPSVHEIPLTYPHVSIYAFSIPQPDGTRKAIYRLGHNYPDNVPINEFDVETIVLAVAANLLRDNGKPELAHQVSEAALDLFQSSRIIDHLTRPTGGGQ